MHESEQHGGVRSGHVRPGDEPPRLEPPDDTGPRRHSRRRVLIAAGLAGAATAGAGTLAVTSDEPAEGTLFTEPGGPEKAGLRTIERVYSHARGRTVQLVTLRPTPVSDDPLPVSLLLHGIRSGAREAASTGLLKALHTDSADGSIRPFAFVAVDGGDNYWQEAQPGDDPMAMLLEEVPGWLRERGLGAPNGDPFGVTGYSMGGFGALLYARRRTERGSKLRAVATVAPALISSWSDMRIREVFSSRADWVAHDPLHHIEALRGVDIGLWCGNQDTFIDGVRRFVRAAKPVHTHFGPGGHVAMFNDAIAAEVVRFVGRRAPG